MRTSGAAAPFSQWLASRGIEAENMLGDYLAGLTQAAKLPRASQ
jgi:hypothetical protein